MREKKEWSWKSHELTSVVGAMRLTEHLHKKQRACAPCMLAKNPQTNKKPKALRGCGGNAPFLFTGFAPRSKVLPFLPSLHLPFRFFSCLQTDAVPGCPGLQRCWCACSPSPPSRRCLCCPSEPVTPSLPGQEGELGQAGPTLPRRRASCSLSKGSVSSDVLLPAGSAHHTGQR